MPRSSLSNIPSCALLACFLVLMSASKATAQDEEVCACSPSTYEFTFDFGLDCDTRGGSKEPGIAEVTCFITSFSSEAVSLVPVSVSSISIIEADLDRVPIAQSAIEGEFASGDSFTYSSVAALGNSSRIPQSIQLTITGFNDENATLVQVWAIKFTNECDVYPVLMEDESFGWTEFTDLGTPQGNLCPIAGGPTFAPDTDAPTAAPTAGTPVPTAGTPAPTASTPEPTLETDPPTVQPAAEPTIQPTTIQPTMELATKAPSLEPTKTTKAPSSKGEKTPDPTRGPSMRPSFAPTRRPSRAPTKDITKEPTPTEYDDDLEPTPEDLSFSYVIELEDEDYEVDTEWGRKSKKEKKKKEDDELRGRVRVGHRRTI